VTEGIGWKVLLSGAFTGTTGWIVSLDWMTVIGVAVVIGGFILQLLARLETRRATLLQIEFDREKHKLEMAILRERLIELRTEHREEKLQDTKLEPI
jgi:hypothetical protein